MGQEGVRGRSAARCGGDDRSAGEPGPYEDRRRLKEWKNVPPVNMIYVISFVRIWPV